MSCVSHRYTAVAMPMLYNTRYSSRRRVTVMISVVWVLSFAISCPLLFGLNNTGEKEAAASRLFFFCVTCICLELPADASLKLLAHICINVSWKGAHMHDVTIRRTSEPLAAQSVVWHSNCTNCCNCSRWTKCCC